MNCKGLIRRYKDPVSFTITCQDPECGFSCSGYSGTELCKEWNEHLRLRREKKKMSKDLEQRRRDLKHNDPKLYSYIRALERAKAYDQAGDIASGSLDGHHAANRLWAFSVANKRVATTLREQG